MATADLAPSSRAAKKWMVVYHDTDGSKKTVHFGSAGMEDYTKGGTEAQKSAYLARHGAGQENWDDPKTAGFWSRWLLWNEKTIPASAADIKSRYGITINYNPTDLKYPK